MAERNWTNGWIALALGLPISRLAHFLQTCALFGSATDSLQGLHNRLSAGALGSAIWLLARSRRTAQDL